MTQRTKAETAGVLVAYGVVIGVCVLAIVGLYAIGLTILGAL